MKFNFTSAGYFLLAVFSGIIMGFSGTILKKGAVDLKLSGGLLAIVKEILSSKYVLISLACSGTGYLIYMFIVRRAEVITTTLIIQGVLFAATMVFSALMFQEAVTPAKILALILITAGIAVLVIGK